MSIDLSQLPPPDVIEPLSYEVILAEILADFNARNKSIILEPHDPAYKLAETVAYRELGIRARVNQAATSVMLAHAKGNDLDNLAAFYKVERLLVDPGDADANPPIEPTFEDDARLLKRIRLAMNQFSTAGSRGSYEYHALTASTDVKDVDIQRAGEGIVQVTLLSEIENGAANSELQTLVDSALNADKVRPLTDSVIVQSAEIIEYQVTANVYCYTGPSATLVIDAAIAALDKEVKKRHRLGYDVHASAIYGALQVEGVQRVELVGYADLVIEPNQAAYCTALNINLGGIDE